MYHKSAIVSTIIALLYQIINVNIIPASRGNEISLASVTHCTRKSARFQQVGAVDVTSLIQSKARNSPYPVWSSWRPVSCRGSTEFMSAILITSIQEPLLVSVGLYSGCSSRSSESAAVTKTVASEVPVLEYHALLFPVLMIPTPGATISGF